VGLDEERRLRKKMAGRETNCLLAFWILLPAEIKGKIISDEQYAIFAHDLRCALKLTVVFTISYCELQQIFRFCVKLVI
jgi:hypothetical protein